MELTQVTENIDHQQLHFNCAYEITCLTFQFNLTAYRMQCCSIFVRTTCTCNSTISYRYYSNPFKISRDYSPIYKLL